MKKIFFALFAGLSLQASYCQYSALNVGDTVPDIVFNNFYRDSNRTLRLSDLKGKLVILDFWNTRCSSCIAAMPRMDSLQQKYRDQIAILTITKDHLEEINSLFERIKMKKVNLPFVIEDTILSIMFPHEGDPFHVWIDQKGVVTAITFSYNTNDKSIGKFLKGINPNFATRRDFGYDRNFPLLSKENSNLLHLASKYSILYEGLFEYSDNHLILVNDTNVRTVNSTLLELYKIAYSDELYGFHLNPFDTKSNNRVIFKVNDIDRFILPQPIPREQIDDWNRASTFSYELKFPKEESARKFDFMRADLVRQFPYKARIEKRKTTCLALICINPRLARTKNPKSDSFYKHSNGVLQLQNSPLTPLLIELCIVNGILTTPIVDATNLKSNVDLIIKSKLNDLLGLNKELAKFGLGLIKKQRVINMLVITD